MKPFSLNEQLASDAVFITDWSLCSLLLRNDKNYPWVILVPRRADISEIYELCQEDQITLTDEIAKISKILKIGLKADKINVAAFGNIVSQLHIHVIARYKTDLAWPKPVWGVAPPVPYDEIQMQELLRHLKGIQT